MIRPGAAARLLFCAACGVIGLAWASQAAELHQVEDFGANPGDLDMYEYAPTSLPEHPALVVALHGCGQKAADYLTATGWKAQADQSRFVLLLPQQAWTNNPMRCFRWWVPESLTRGTGEPASILNMINKTATSHAIDRSRIYVTGLSAGGAMSLALTALYPDVFAGGAPVATVPFHCADGMMAAGTCMSGGTDLSPQDWASRARTAAPGNTRSWPRLSVWQGGDDGVVNPRNMGEIMEQWTELHGIGQSAAAEETVGGHTRKAYRDTSGKTLVETNLITTLSHGVAIDPKHGCGKAESYVIDAQVCSTEHIARFWGLR